MHQYDYQGQWQTLVTPEMLSIVTQIHEYKGQQNLFVAQKAETLTTLLEIAKVQSTEASNKIEGIYTSDERLKLLAMDKTTPTTRNEEEIAGYRDVLATIHQNHDFIPLKSSMLLQLHRDLYKYSGLGIGGSYKIADNLITEEYPDGTKRVRFTPLPAWEVPAAIEALCETYQQTLAQSKASPLLLIPMFVLDFLCVHPFADGNGRMSRLLTLLLLYRSGYIVGKYISIEKRIEQTKETYYEALQASSVGWHQNQNDYEPFARYLLGVILASYREFESHVELLVTKGYSKPERIAALIEQTMGKITKRELQEKCPDISSVTLQRTLVELVKVGKIQKIGGGRYTQYIWNREDV